MLVSCAVLCFKGRNGDACGALDGIDLTMRFAGNVRHQ